MWRTNDVIAWTPPFLFPTGNSFIVHVVSGGMCTSCNFFLKSGHAFCAPPEF